MPLHAAKPNLEDVGGKPMTSRQPDEGVTRKRRREAREAASCTRNARVRQGLAGALRLWRTPPFSTKRTEQPGSGHPGAKRHIRFKESGATVNKNEKGQSSQASGEKQGKSRQTRHAAKKCSKFHIARANNILFRYVAQMVCTRATNCTQNIIFGKDSD